VIDGINEIREKLNKGGTSVRLIGLSGVGKTRFSQALLMNVLEKRVLIIGMFGIVI
jgi:DNA replication protein DnaC